MTWRWPTSPSQARKDLHQRYAIEAAPTILIADHEGVVHASFVGTPSATDLWAAVAEARDPGSTPECDRGRGVPRRRRRRWRYPWWRVVVGSWAVMGAAPAGDASGSWPFSGTMSANWGTSCSTSCTGRP